MRLRRLRDQRLRTTRVMSEEGCGGTVFLVITAGERRTLARVSFAIVFYKAGPVCRELYERRHPVSMLSAEYHAMFAGARVRCSQSFPSGLQCSSRGRPRVACPPVRTPGHAQREPHVLRLELHRSWQATGRSVVGVSSKGVNVRSTERPGYARRLRGSESACELAL